MKKILSLVIALMLILSSTAFAEIILAHDKLNPNYQPYFEAWAKMCQEATGVTFTPVSYPSTDIFTANMKAALPTDAAPQIFTWWSTWQGAELVQAGLVRDLTDVWDQLKDEYDEGLRGAFTFDGKVYGFPLDLAYWFMWYNTSVYEKYGLKVPETWDEMMANCDVLVKNGVTPFSLTGSDSWTSFIWFEEILMHSNPQAYEDLCAGKIKWTDDAVKNVFVIWKDMIDKGYFTTGNPDYFTDIPKMFTEDRLAMIMGGSWYLSPQLDSAYADGKVGSFLVPHMEGQPQRHHLRGLLHPGGQEHQGRRCGRRAQGRQVHDVQGRQPGLRQGSQEDPGQPVRQHRARAAGHLRPHPGHQGQGLPVAQPLLGELPDAHHVHRHRVLRRLHQEPHP